MTIDEKIEALELAKAILDDDYGVTHHLEAEDWGFAHSCAACQMMVVIAGIDEAIDFHEWDKEKQEEVKSDE